MFPKLITVAVALLLLLPNASAGQESSAAGGANSVSPSAIFQFTNIWTIHLSFTPEQWDAMEPKQQGGPGFGGRRGSGSFLQGPEGGRNGIAAAFEIVFDYVRGSGVRALQIQGRGSAFQRERHIPQFPRQS